MPWPFVGTLSKKHTCIVYDNAVRGCTPLGGHLQVSVCVNITRSSRNRMFGRSAQREDIPGDTDIPFHQQAKAMLVHLPDHLVDDVVTFLEAGAVAASFGPVARLSSGERAAYERLVRDQEACAVALAHSLAAIVTRTAARNDPPTPRRT